jgi:hypothetical protein
MGFSTGTCGSNCSTVTSGTVTLALTGGTTYFIELSTSSPSATLSVELLTSPANDRCAGALPLTAGVPVYGSTKGALNDWNCNGTGPGNDVIYSFAPASSGAFSAVVLAGATAPGTDAGSYFSTSTIVTDGLCDAGSCLVSSYNSSPANFRASPGTTYGVIVDSYYANEFGDFKLLLSSISPPANDTCSSPAVLNVGTTVNATFTSAIPDTRDTSCGYGNYPDLFYSFAPTTSGNYLFTSSASMGFSTGTCGSNCSTVTSGTVTLALTGGTTYFIELSTSSPSATLAVEKF